MFIYFINFSKIPHWLVPLLEKPHKILNNGVDKCVILHIPLYVCTRIMKFNLERRDHFHKFQKVFIFLDAFLMKMQLQRRFMLSSIPPK